MNEKLIEKAKKAASAEEILEIAKENDIYMVKQEAEMIYKQLHTNAEVSDEELESVAGGCTGSGGKTIVTSGCKCFNGKYERISGITLKDGGMIRGLWETCTADGCCGRCEHLVIKNGMGYCGVE